MNQNDLDILFQKYLAGQCSETEEQTVLDWVKNNEGKDINMPSEEKLILKNRLWKKIDSNTKSTFRWKKNIFKYAAAILVFAAMGFGAYFKFNNQKFTITENADGFVMKNATQVVQSITLEDGSKVDLSPNSSLSYPQHFGNKRREVYLKGEAFFSVFRNPSKPFIVHSGNLSTEVLGTSFRIKSLPNTKSIEVEVVTGRVSVFANSNTKNRNGIILTPNQKIAFNEETKEIIPGIVEKPLILKPELAHVSLNFDDTKLSKVIAQLKEIYGIEIIVENDALNNCVFTGDLNGILLHEQIELICKSVNARYEQRGTSIFIYGEGLN